MEHNWAIWTGISVPFKMLQAIWDRHAGLADMSTGTGIPFCLTCIFQSETLYLKQITMDICVVGQLNHSYDSINVLTALTLRGFFAPITLSFNFLPVV